MKFRSIFIKIGGKHDEIDEKIERVSTLRPSNLGFFCSAFQVSTECARKKLDMFCIFLKNFWLMFCKILRVERCNSVYSSTSRRSRKMLQNEYLVAKFGFDTAKNEPRQVLHFLAWKLDLNAHAKSVLTGLPELDMRIWAHTAQNKVKWNDLCSQWSRDAHKFIVADPQTCPICSNPSLG